MIIREEQLDHAFAEASEAQPAFRVWLVAVVAGPPAHQCKKPGRACLGLNPMPNTYEVPGCQETDYPYERIFSHFFRFVCSESIVTWQHVLT